MRQILAMALVCLLAVPALAKPVYLRAGVISVKLDAERKFLLVEVEHLSDGFDEQHEFFIDPTCIANSTKTPGRCTAFLHHKSTTGLSWGATTAVRTVVINIQESLRSKFPYDISQMPLLIMGEHPITKEYSEAQVVLP